MVKLKLQGLSHSGYPNKVLTNLQPDLRCSVARHGAMNSSDDVTQ